VNSFDKGVTKKDSQRKLNSGNKLADDTMFIETQIEAMHVKHNMHKNKIYQDEDYKRLIAGTPDRMDHWLAAYKQEF
jgi:hypothetical protein